MSEGRAGPPVPREEVRDRLRAAARGTRRLGEATARRNGALLAALEGTACGVSASERLLHAARERDDAETRALRERLSALAAENEAIARASVELEEHANRLASLYTAIFRLHAELEEPAVLRSVCEVVLNLIGAEAFTLRLVAEAVWWEAARDGDLVVPGVRLAGPEHDLERRALAARRTLLADAPSAGEPLSATPLLFQGCCVGVLTLHRLLSHKKGLSGLDRELFDLLGEQAASAIVSARTYAAAGRKLRTAKGLLALIGTG